MRLHQSAKTTYHPVRITSARTSAAVKAQSSLFMMLLCLTGCTVTQPDAEPELTVGEYCREFALAFASQRGADYETGSAATVRKTDAARNLSNLFQPPGSRLVVGHDCTFRADGREYEVAILLAETEAFARHTQWERLQLIPIRCVTDGRRTGYGVFKYLEER